MFRTCLWSYGSQNSTNTTQSICACLNHEERDKQKKVSANRWMWRYPFENHFLMRLRRRLPVTRFTMYWYKPRGYQADDLCLSLSLYAFRIYIFPQHFCAIHVYAHTCACPYKAAQMYFGRVSPKPVLGMIEFPQFVQTMIEQVICTDLSAFSRFLRVSLRRNLITTAISATETKW